MQELQWGLLWELCVQRAAATFLHSPRDCVYRLLLAVAPAVRFNTNMKQLSSYCQTDTWKPEALICKSGTAKLHFLTSWLEKLNEERFSFLRVLNLEYFSFFELIFWMKSCLDAGFHFSNTGETRFFFSFVLSCCGICFYWKPAHKRLKMAPG